MEGKFSQLERDNYLGVQESGVGVFMRGPSLIERLSEIDSKIKHLESDREKLRLLQREVEADLKYTPRESSVLKYLNSAR